MTSAEDQKAIHLLDMTGPDGVQRVAPTQVQRLRTGEELPEPVIAAVLHAINRLVNAQEATALYELVTLARDPEHQVWGALDEVLIGVGLLEKDGTMHDSVRRIVVAAAVGEGRGISFRSPLDDDN